MPSKTVKAKSKSVEPINKCEFLKGEYKRVRCAQH